MKLTRSHLLAVVLAVVVAGATYILTHRPPPEPAELVRRKVVQMAAAAEKKDVAFIMDQVSTRFRSEEGWSRDELKAYLVGQLLRGEWIRVFTTDIQTSTLSPTSVNLSPANQPPSLPAHQLTFTFRSFKVG